MPEKLGKQNWIRIKMDRKTFKEIINKLACRYGFESKFASWFKVSDECIIGLTLQKSNYSDSYYLNIKIFMQGIRGLTYSVDRNLIMKEPGNIFRRQPTEYDTTFDLDSSLSDEQRIHNLEYLFSEFIKPFSEKGLSIKGIKELWKEGQICLLPAAENYINSVN